jgi:hypothetical protein
MADLAAGCGYFDQSHFIERLPGLLRPQSDGIPRRTTIWAGRAPPGLSSNFSKTPRPLSRAD